MLVMAREVNDERRLLQSNSQKRERKEALRNFFFAGPEEIILYFILGLGCLTILNVRAFADNVAGLTDGSPDSVGHFIIEYINSFLSRGRLSEILFWGIVGTSVYFVLWLVRNVWVNIHNDFAVDKFQHPLNYDKTKYWQTVVRYKLAFILCLFFLAGYFYLASFGFPYISHQFYLAVTGTSWFHQLPLIFGLVTVAAAAFYALEKILLALANLWKTILAGF